MSDAVRVHDAIVRGTIERHGGYVFGVGGDGFAAAFSSPADAAAAAVESQEQLRDDDLVDFGVRMGLHTGEAVERDRNYFGSEVNRAARLMSLAHGGQVLVSDTTEVLLRDRVAVRPLGEHRLRGLRGRMGVYQVVAEGLPTDFPVLRSVDSFPGNLPQQLSSFVGREQVIDEVAELVRSRRLVTLSGVGGVGKTRLALEAGAEVAGEFPDGVWMIELASVGDAGFRARGDRERAGHHTPRRRVVDRHRRRIVGWSARSPRDRQLRARGRCRGVGDRRDPRPVAERQDPRHVTRGARGRRRVDVGRCAARVGRRRDVRRRHAVRRPGARGPSRLRAPRARHRGRGDRDLRVARRLPLGIELAAARMAAMSAVEVRDRLADRFRLLAGIDARTGASAHLASCRCLVVRPPDRRGAGAPRPGVGVRGRLRPHEHLRGGRRSSTTSTYSAISIRWSASRSWSPTTRRPAPATACSRPSASSRRIDWRRAGVLEPTRDRHSRVLRARGGRALGTLERARDGATRSTGSKRSWGTCAPGTSGAPHAATSRSRPTSRRTPRSSGSRYSCSKRWPGPRSCIEPAAAADVRRLPRLYTAAGYACFAGRAEAARVNAHRATELEVDPRYDGMRTRIRHLHRGTGQRVLRRPRSVRRAHRVGRRAVRECTGLRPRLVRRRPPVVRSHRGSARARRGVGCRREITRQPLLDRVRALDRRAWRSRRRTRAARSRRGTKASPSYASTASSSSKASSHATRRACTRPTANPRRRS